IQRVAVVAPTLQGGVEVSEPHLGEKTEKSQVHAENWRTARGEDPSHRKKRSVSPENDDEFRREQRQILAVNSLRGGRVLSGLAVHHRLIAALAKPTNQFGQDPGEFFLLRLTANCDATHAVPV